MGWTKGSSIIIVQKASATETSYLNEENIYAKPLTAKIIQVSANTSCRSTFVRSGNKTSRIVKQCPGCSWYTVSRNKWTRYLFYWLVIKQQPPDRLLVRQSSDPISRGPVNCDFVVEISEAWDDHEIVCRTHIRVLVQTVVLLVHVRRQEDPFRFVAFIRAVHRKSRSAKTTDWRHNERLCAMQTTSRKAG